MKNITLFLICIVCFSCKKDFILHQPVSDTSHVKTPIASVPSPTNQVNVNVKDHGALGDGVADDTEAIKASMAYAKSKSIPTVYFPEGTYLIKGTGSKAGVINLLDGVSLKGAGKSVSHIKLSGGRFNPNSIFYQAWWDEPSVSNIVIQGLDFDGNIANQTFDASYQYGHGLSINNGTNIEISNCKFDSFRGDGCLFGDTFLASLNLRITSNVSVHDSEFDNIYREGAMFCCVNGASFYNNYVHGNGYLVGGVDIERHSPHESVLNVSVYNNTFDFRNSYGPVERGGPIVKYRRAVTMGFFYAGYPDHTVDGLSSGHKIYGNKIYQAQIDCWGHTNVSITNNTFTNSYENIAGVGWLSTPAINIADPSSTKGLSNMVISNNNINSTMACTGISFKNYTNVSVKADTITGTQLSAININASSGVFDANVITNIGTSVQRASGIIINGNCSGLILSNNKVQDTQVNNSRTVNYAVEIQSYNNASIVPQIKYNIGTNMCKGVISEFYPQSGYSVLTGNVSH